MWDDIDIERFKDNETYTPLGSQELLGVATDPPSAETVGRAMLAVASSSEGREEERHNSGYPCQGLPIANTGGFNRTCVPSTIMPRLQFVTEIVKYCQLLLKTGIYSNVASF